jgi:hypothetical protein
VRRKPPQKQPLAPPGSNRNIGTGQGANKRRRTESVKRNMRTETWEKLPDFYPFPNEEIHNLEFRKMTPEKVFKTAKVEDWKPCGYVRAVFVKSLSTVFLYKFN